MAREVLLGKRAEAEVALMSEAGLIYRTRARRIAAYGDEGTPRRAQHSNAGTAMDKMLYW